MKLRFPLAVLILCTARLAAPSSGTTTQGISAAISPIAKVSVPSSLTLTHSGTIFNPFTATLVVSYKAHTTAINSTGGNLTMQITSDFTPSGGPSAASGALTYGCSGAGLGTACSGTITASTSSQTSVVVLPKSACTGGGGSCSGSNPATVSVSFSLDDNPAYPTGTYSAVATFFISAT